MVLLLVFMQLTRDQFAIAKFLFSYAVDKQTESQIHRQTKAQTDADERFTSMTVIVVSNYKECK